MYGNYVHVCVFVCLGSRPRGYSVSSLSLASLNLADSESVKSDKRTSRWDQVQFTVTFPQKSFKRLKMSHSCINQYWHISVVLFITLCPPLSMVSLSSLWLLRGSRLSPGSLCFFLSSPKGRKGRSVCRQHHTHVISSQGSDGL